MKKRFDVAVVVPLDEEFETALSYFQYIADLSTSQRIRFEVAVSGNDISILLVKQNVMGRTECGNATMDNRLKLLGVAQESLKAAGLRYDKAGLQRLIDRETGPQIS